MNQQDNRSGGQGCRKGYGCLVALRLPIYVLLVGIERVELPERHLRRNCEIARAEQAMVGLPRIIFSFRGKDLYKSFPL